MNELGPSARRLLDLARGEDDPDPSRRSRVAHALAAKMAAGTSVIAASATARAWAGTLASSSVAKSTLIVGVTGALAAVGWLALRPVPTRAPRPAIAWQAPPPARETSEAQEQTQQEDEKEPPRSRQAVPRINPKLVRSSPKAELPASEPTTAAQDNLRDETQALRLAQRALREKTPQKAIELLDQQDRQFGKGLLQEERAAARILALCQAGRVEDARVHALRFERSWPRSALFGRIRFACWQPDSASGGVESQPREQH